MSATLPTFSRSQVYDALQRGFGHQEFRPGQADVLRSVLQGRHTIAVLPTGGGKSLGYQLPAVLFEGTSLVISPLIALMRDQVLALRARGIPAASLDSTQSMDERREVEDALAAGRLRLLYVSPERLDSERFLELLSQVEVPFVAVDEAHCVLRWGHEFRDAYLRIRPFLERVQPRHLAAFTATATPELRDELGEALGMQEPDVWVRGFFRDNLRLDVERAGSEVERRARLLELVRGRDGEAPALVYAATRAAAEETAVFLRDAGLAAVHYHGGTESEARNAAQDDFLADRLDALVATNAFGMGIDKPDIRLLVHVCLPASFEDYYQEVGRAARDGAASRAVLLWSGRDYRTRSFLAEQQEDSRAQDAALRRLNRLYDAVRGRGCLWRTVLSYFGDPQAQVLGADGCGCGACARCLEGDVDLVTLGGAARAEAIAVLEGVKELDGRYGRRKIAGILTGSRAKGVPTWPQAHGALPRMSQPLVEELLQTLLDAGFLQIVGSEYPLVAVTAEGEEALRGETELVVHATPGRTAPSASRAASPGASPGDVDPELLARLKAWRTGEAREREVPPYVVFPDRTLQALAAMRPGDEPALLAVPGIGPKKAEQYGGTLLRLLAEAAGIPGSGA